ncbi:hypothetical protein LB572_00910 [Mesorhizobium sp. BH1-1-5]|uniref:hypothetical protein n=1 Tax=Mesorhizobium sp. BH1-1-5 TaxID=2876661 RepID=UPI001CCB3A7E|nr:hypothetical protein [Mesorhizobium sp. BH1-1-5]MBZ9985648.1 hypothetical protein [Mesorhizobium sp. BH1-1-5]
MAKKPKDEMLPAVNGLQIDIDDKSRPTQCLIGLRTAEGVKSFSLHAAGARLLIAGLQTFVDRVDKNGNY